MALDRCSDPAVYASALLQLEEERKNQLRFAMALDGQSCPALRARILRILGSSEPTSPRFRPVSIAILAAALVVFSCPVPHVLASLHAAPKGGAEPVSAAVTDSTHAALRAAKPSAAVPADSEASSSEPSSSVSSKSESSSSGTGAQETPAPAPRADAAAQTPTAGHSDYIDAMRVAGYNVDLDKYIAMKVQGVTPEYAAAMAKEFGRAISADQLIAMKVQELTPEYMAQMRAAGYDADLSKYIAMKVEGITPEYAAAMAKAGFGKPDANQLIALKVQNVTPDYAEKLRAAGIEVFEPRGSDRVSHLRRDAGFPRADEGRRLRCDPSEETGYAARAGVTAEYAKSIRAQFPDATVDQLIQLRIFNIDADFVASATRHGFAPLTIDKLVKLRISGILDGDQAKESRP